MKKLINKLNHENFDYSEQAFADLDKQFSFGVSAKTNTGKVIYESIKTIYVMVNVISSKNRKFKILEYQKNKLNSLRVKFADDINFVLVNDKEACRNGELISHSEIHHTNDMTIKYDGNDLKEEYNRQKQKMTEIGELFDIDAKNSKYISTSLCRNIAFKKLRTLNGCEHVTDDEDVYLSGSCRGALYFADVDAKIKDVYDYDINGMYTYLMAKSDFRFPLNCGKIVDIKTETKNVLEIYKLNIKGTHKYFRNTPDNYYTSYDMRILKLLKIDYEYIGDTKMVYENPIKSNQIFDYLESMYKIKKENKYVKPVSNCTWGNLSRKKQYVVAVQNYDPKKHKNIVKMTMGHKIILQSDKRPYKHVTARIKTFLLSYARYYMLKNIIIPLEESGYNIYQINTDGFITNCKPDDTNDIYDVSEKFGSLKIEKHYEKEHTIKHVHKIEEDEFDNIELDAKFDENSDDEDE